MRFLNLREPLGNGVRGGRCIPFSFVMCLVEDALEFVEVFFECGHVHDAIGHSSIFFLIYGVEASEGGGCLVLCLVPDSLNVLSEGVSVLGPGGRGFFGVVSYGFEDGRRNGARECFKKCGVNLVGRLNNVLFDATVSADAAVGRGVVWVDVSVDGDILLGCMSVSTDEVFCHEGFVNSVAE